MMHDFALTPGYVVLLDLPVTFSLDAVSAGVPVARVHLPARIPLGFHGSWIADQ